MKAAVFSISQGRLLKCCILWPHSIDSTTFLLFKTLCHLSEDVNVVF
jgi:hypothetical protein